MWWVQRSFQSLSGFRVRCNLQLPTGEVGLNQGFNPYRVFEYVATLRNRFVIAVGVDVSIPIGFSSTLQRRQCGTGSEHRGRFQSLSGFRVRCNIRSGCLPAESGICFNPYRVFEYVATGLQYFLPGWIRRVSIPIGFSSTLQHNELIAMRLNQLSFPWKTKKIKCKRRVIHLLQATFSGRSCSQKYLQAPA